MERSDEMLGYIRTDAPELRIREYDRYRALYCGLCRHMGKCTGQCSRLSLSYDFAFLAAFRMSLTNETLELQKKKNHKKKKLIFVCLPLSVATVYLHPYFCIMTGRLQQVELHLVVVRLVWSYS